MTGKKHFKYSEQLIWKYTDFEENLCSTYTSVDLCDKARG